MNMKRLISMLLALTMVLALFGACTPADNTDGTSAKAPAGKLKYQVTVIDPKGQPCSDGVAVKFFDKDGKQAAMQMTDANGIAARELEAGDYTVELMFTDTNASYSFDTANLTLSATKTELKIDLYNQPKESMILHYEEKEHEAYFVGPGMTKVKVTPGERTFFVFTTRETGFYEMSVTGDIAKFDQYGGVHYVTSYGTGIKAEGKENVLQLNLHFGYVSENGAQEFVLGVDAAEGTTEVILNLMRLGDYIVTPVIAPWTIYQTTAELKPFTLPAGTNVADAKEFYMANAYDIVYNEQDGYYHVGTADGPLVLLRLGKNAEDYCRFLLAPFESLFGTSEILGYYVYDDNGEFVEKIGFVECLKEYVTVMDEASGLCPVTKDLKHILETLGESKQWWALTEDGQPVNTGSFQFWDESGNPITNLNLDTVWLFNCCYFE